jgi:glycosyltransferase involved in cell wall biosynthesis
MKDLLFLSMVRWDTIYQRPQHLAMGLSKHFRILYVDPVAYSILGAIRNHLLGDGTRNYRPVLRLINDNLIVYTPAPMFHFSEDYWFINEINHKILWVFLSKLLAKYDFRDPIIYINSPYQLPLLKYFPRSLECYDCMDQYEAFYRLDSRRRQIIIQKEEQVISQVQVAFATSENLAHRISSRNTNVYLVQNGVNELFLNYANHIHSASPPDFPLGEGPVIGYIGVVSHWFDINAIRALAERHPDWRFVMLGPVMIKIDLLQNLSNIYFLGIKEYGLLPAYVENFDICIIPFVLNELTKAVNPVKVYEYFALGKTVVASRLPELVKFEDICYLADSSNDFVAKVETAIQDLHDKNPGALFGLETRRRKVAMGATWQQRVEKIYSAIDKSMGQTV